MTLTYDARSDRLFGGDFFREFSGRWTLSLILSVRRGKLLYETLGTLHEAYKNLSDGLNRSERPFSQALAMIELHEIPMEVNGKTRMISIDELFNLPRLSQPPFEYRQLAQLVTVVPDTATLGSHPFRFDGATIDSFVHQLFFSLGCGHGRAEVSFGNARGSNVSAASLTRSGEFVDVYWFTRGSEARQNLAAFQLADVNKGLSLAVSLARETATSIQRAIESAAAAYMNFAAHPADWQGACREAAEKVRSGGSLESLAPLAAMLRQSYSA